MPSSSEPAALLRSRPFHAPAPLRPKLHMKSGSETSSFSSRSYASSLKKPWVNPEQPSFRGASLPPRVSTLERRIYGWSWDAFPIGMGSSAVYLTLSGLKVHPELLTNVETAFFFINLSLFVLNSSTLLLQAFIYPQQSRRQINDPVKGLFVPLIVLSFATILVGITNYGVIPGYISVDAIYVLFWIYVLLSVAVSFLMLMIWFNKPHDVTTFTPACALLIFPMLLVGLIASNVLQVIDPSQSRAIGVLFVGYFFQGIGFFMTMFYICIYILRIMMTGFMEGGQANGAFEACASPGFTALALLELGSQARKILPLHNLVSPLAGEIWFASSVLVGLCLFGLSVFFFAFGLLPYWFKVHKDLSEILGCWALTLPNVGWISCLRVLGDILQIPGFYAVHTIMAAVMCIVWIVLSGLTVLAFWKGEIFFATEADILRDEIRTT